MSYESFYNWRPGSGEDSTDARHHQLYTHFPPSSQPATEPFSRQPNPQAYSMAPMSQGSGIEWEAYGTDYSAFASSGLHGHGYVQGSDPYLTSLYTGPVYEYNVYAPTYGTYTLEDAAAAVSLYGLGQPNQAIDPAQCPSNGTGSVSRDGLQVSSRRTHDAVNEVDAASAALPPGFDPAKWRNDGTVGRATTGEEGPIRVFTYIPDEDYVNKWTQTQRDRYDAGRAAAAAIAQRRLRSRRAMKAEQRTPDGAGSIARRVKRESTSHPGPSSLLGAGERSFKRSCSGSGVVSDDAIITGEVYPRLGTE